MYLCLHSRIHKDIGTSDDLDRPNAPRHVLVRAAVTTQLCHHTRQLPQSNGRGNHPLLHVPFFPAGNAREVSGAVCGMATYPRHQRPQAHRWWGWWGRCVHAYACTSAVAACGWVGGCELVETGPTSAAPSGATAAADHRRPGHPASVMIYGRAIIYRIHVCMTAPSLSVVVTWVTVCAG